MEPSLLLWGILTFVVVHGHVTELCDENPPDIQHATFKALTYKTGTMLNCECKKGFRRISNGSAFMLCAGNSSHSSWENKCRCISTSPRATDGQVIPKPEEQKGKSPMGMQSQMQPTDQVNLPGHCREPPPWEHEDSRRIYHFVVGQAVHYQCMQGFRALHRGPAKSVCKMICGKATWTQPPLQCISERSDGWFPDDEEPQASTDAALGSDTSCPSITASTTDFQKHTEAAMTTESFVFTTEYQIAVAGCVLLLISIVLLSGLTWQRRWRKSRRTI
ncbi:interleukin-2 receptor subunit alpha isoform X2 [Panthera tigris]|uniref:interleukin-2 receptor subunit alpha isoform X2 n=1 Tax=Panthera leo TaxID=9689 RepID=UPI001C6A172C|nr:interleukin-2 receptor subunit alpha isoform X2 [Panthera leo]XP_042846908.1 interleukin-2 receptor subunit alpha isoform X2 [Panthera tigris]